MSDLPWNRRGALRTKSQIQRLRAQKQRIHWHTLSREKIAILSERPVFRIMNKISLTHRPKRKPKGITKADREARKSDDLLKRDFRSDEPLKKCVTDITEIKDKDGKLYVSAIFDCFDSGVLGLDMEENRKATLCENAMLAHMDLRGTIIHSDRGTQYTSERYRKAIAKYGVQQSMNSAGGRCHDNARCERMFQEHYRWGSKVRAVTARAIDFVPQNEADQLSMFVDTERLTRREKLEDAIEELRGRFDKHAITYGILLGDLKMPDNGRHSVKVPGMMYQ